MSILQTLLDSIPPYMRGFTDNKLNISDKIDARMKELNLTDKQLKKLTGFSYDKLNSILTGMYNLNLRDIAILEHTLQTKLITVA